MRKVEQPLRNIYECETEQKDGTNGESIKLMTNLIIPFPKRATRVKIVPVHTIIHASQMNYTKDPNDLQRSFRTKKSNFQRYVDKSESGIMAARKNKGDKEPPYDSPTTIQGLLR